MKSEYVYRAGIILLLIAAISTCTDKKGTEPLRLDDVSFDDYSVYEPGCSEEVIEEIRELHDRPVYHLVMIIDETLRKVEGSAAVRFVNETNGDLTFIDFLLFPNNTEGRIHINSAAAGSSSLEFEYIGGGSVLRVFLASFLPPGDEIVLHISYTLTVPEEKTVGYGSIYAGENTLSLGYAYPLLPSVNHSPVRMPALYGDHVFSDASFYCVQIQAPKEMEIFAGGYRAAEWEDGDSRFVVYAAGPVKEFYAGCMKGGELESRSADGVMIRSYSTPADRESSRLVLDFAEKSLRLFSRIYGEYPYLNLTFTSMPLTAFGLEFPGIIINSESMYRTGGYIRGVPAEVLLESTTVHEAAHQWFYNLSGNDQRIEPWIDEGLAQYSTWLYYHEYYGESAAESFKQSLYSRWDRIGRTKISIELPVSAYSAEEYSAVIYGLAPIIFIDFARYAGEERFFEAVRTYVSQTRWKNGSGVLLKQVFKETCGESFSSFFEQWAAE